MYRLFSWEHSYFSGKVRAYLRYKDRNAALGHGFEDILATPELILGLLLPRSGSSAVPQLEAPDGSWVQDSSEIIDFCEAAHPEAPVVINLHMLQLVSSDLIGQINELDMDDVRKEMAEHDHEGHDHDDHDHDHEAVKETVE